MTTTRRRQKQSTITAWQRGRFTGAVRGPVRVVHPAIKRLGIPWQWDAQRGCYLVPRQHFDDLLAALELDGHHVDYQMAGWS